MKRFALLVLLLAACGQAGKGADGYRFEKKEWDRPQVAITIVTHPSVVDMRRAYAAKYGTTGDPPVMAWSVINATGCTIHVADPGKAWQPEYLGHEFAHCAWGRFHPSQ